MLREIAYCILRTIMRTLSLFFLKNYKPVNPMYGSLDQVMLYALSPLQYRFFSCLMSFMQ